MKLKDIAQGQYYVITGNDNPRAGLGRYLNNRSVIHGFEIGDEVIAENTHTTYGQGVFEINAECVSCWKKGLMQYVRIEHLKPKK